MNIVLGNRMCVEFLQDQNVQTMKHCKDTLTS